MLKYIVFFLILISSLFIGCGGGTSSTSNNLFDFKDDSGLEINKFISVIDGDTIQFEDYKVREYGVEAFEYSSTDRMTEQAEECTNGDESLITFLGFLTKNQVETIMQPSNEYNINIVTTDVYNRIIGSVVLFDYAEKELGLLLVEQGFLVPNIMDNNLYKEKLIEAMNNAKLMKKGLWENYYNEMNCLTDMYNYN